MLIYTIGHSTRTADELIRILKAYEVRDLVDVKRFPTSQKNPHFSKQILQSMLPAVGIAYHWLGDELGGFRSGGYENYMETAEFFAGIDRILGLAEEKVVAIMCAESLWFRCHRRFIADHLAGKGIEVIHIFDIRNAKPHTVNDDEREPE